MLQNSKAEELIEGVKKYISTNYNLIKMRTIERSSTMLSSLLGVILIGLVLLLFVFFASIAAGFYLSYKCGNTYIGFAIVAGFYLLVGIILVLTKKKCLEEPIRDRIIKEILNEN
jgi:protein-S-isoprenylcysteine O-methyltransferase Ste14